MAKRSLWVVILLSIGISVAVIGSNNTFGDASLGYTIEYPTDWVVERPSEFTVRFTGVAWTPASRVTFAIQNVASAAIGGRFEDTAELLDDLKCQLATGGGDVCIYVGDSITVVDAAGRRLVGPQIVSEYEYDGDVYKEWIAVVPHGSGDIFYVLSYTALQNDYDRYEPTVLDMVSTWTIGGTTEDETAPPTTSAGSGEIVVLLEDTGHIGPYDYAAAAYDKRYYNVTVPSHGYLAIAVIDEAGESISGWVYTPGGVELVHKAGGFAEIYTDAYEVLPGVYEVKIGQDTIVTESDFAVYVFFSTALFAIDDLEALFGSKYQVMP